MIHKKLILASCCVLLALACYLRFGLVEHSRTPDPSGRYFSIISYRPYYYIPLPIMYSGVHSDTPCFMEIQDLSGISYGRVPLASIQSAEIRWEADSVGNGQFRWDFSAITCSYWDDETNAEVVIQN